MWEEDWFNGSILDTEKTLESNRDSGGDIPLAKNN